jgi:CHAT domain-containing protein
LPARFAASTVSSDMLRHPCRRSLLLLLALSLLTGTLAAQSDQEAKKAAADKLYAEAVQLFKESAKDSLEQAIGKLLAAIQLYHDARDTDDEADTLRNIGLIYDGLGENQKALDYYNQALPLARIVGNRVIEAETLSGIGAVYAGLGEQQKALDYYNQALPLRRAVGDRHGEAVTLTDIGTVYSNLGEQNKALDYYEQSLPVYREVRDRIGEARTLNNIGFVNDVLGEQQKALDYYNQALPLTRAVGDRIGEAVTLNNIGLIHAVLGEMQKALDYYNQALVLTRATGYRRGEATSLSSIGAVYKTLGEQQRALDYFNQALLLRRAVGDRHGEAESLGIIGAIYFVVPREQQKALGYYNQALPLFRAVGDRGGEAETLGSIALVYAVMGEKQKALDYTNQGLQLARAAGNRSVEATALYSIGLLYDDLGEPQKALEYFEQSLAMSRSLGDRSGEAVTLFSIADLQRDRGNLAEALTQIEASLSIIESLRTKIANQALRSSYFATVQDYYQSYIDLLMRLHKQQPSAGYDHKALQVSERARARSLLETLAEAGADIRQGVDPKLLERERSLQRQLNARAQAQMKLLSSKHTEEQARDIAQEIQALTTEFQQVETEIKQRSPNYAALTQPQPLTLKEIQTQVLDADTLLLEYSLGKDRSYLWAVTPDSIKSYELPKRDEIEATARRLYDLLNARNKRVKGETKEQWQTRVAQADGEIPAAATALSEMVLAPVAAQLGKKRLVIVADGVLQYIPFAVLSAPSVNAVAAAPQPLIVEHEIVSLPSASTLAVIRREIAGRQPAPKMIVALADPVFMKNDERLKGGVKAANTSTNEAAPRAESVRELQLVEAVEDTGAGEGLYVPRLVGSRKEAEEIVAMAPAVESKLALDFDASRVLATSSELSQYRYVHFSTHGFLNSVHPELSGIVFSLVNERGEAQDGFLRAHEVFNLKLPAELVVLSACQTGIGKEVKGEGLVSLTRGFMYAGAPRVVVSLWSVSEMGTTELMVRFYREMLKEGKTPAAALRAAQISLMKEKRWASPFYWAPFTLQGEWR